MANPLVTIHTDLRALVAALSLLATLPEEAGPERCAQVWVDLEDTPVGDVGVNDLVRFLLDCRGMADRMVRDRGQS